MYFIQWINVVDHNVKIGNNPEYQLKIYFEWIYPYSKNGVVGGYEAIVEIWGLTYNYAWVWFNTGLTYMATSSPKGFILAKREFNKATSLFKYIEEHYYDKSMSKQFPIQQIHLAFFIELS